MLKHGPKPFDPKLSGCFKIAPLFSAIWFINFHFLLWAWPRDDEEKVSCLPTLAGLWILESASSSHSSAESDPSSSEVSLEYDSSSFTSEAGSSCDPEVLPFMYEPVVASASSHSETEEDSEDSDSDEGVHPRLLNLD